MNKLIFGPSWGVFHHHLQSKIILIIFSKDQDKMFPNYYMKHVLLIKSLMLYHMCHETW